MNRTIAIACPTVLAFLLIIAISVMHDVNWGYEPAFCFCNGTHLTLKSTHSFSRELKSCWPCLGKLHPELGTISCYAQKAVPPAPAAGDLCDNAVCFEYTHLFMAIALFFGALASIAKYYFS